MKKESIILVINSGSSSIKFATYRLGDGLIKRNAGRIEGIGTNNSTIVATADARDNQGAIKVDAVDFEKATNILINYVENNIQVGDLVAIGHRIVFGMGQSSPAVITEQLLSELMAFERYDPDHLPSEIQIIQCFKSRFPSLLQVACFDTSFHSTIPELAKWFAIPASLFNEGVRRYGYHGLSYSFLMEELKRREGLEFANRRIILAHLGSGASLAAVKGGQCVDTSMGFTPAGGIVMGTRCGDIDPGIAWYLMDRKKMTSTQFNQLINHESGLLGVSGKSSDMRDLLTHEGEPGSARAIDLFCYVLRKWIGAFIAVLNGLDGLVFAGGIGENAGVIRKRICKEFTYCGLEMDEERNDANLYQISSEKSAVKVFVVHTDEEIVMARSVKQAWEKSKQPILN